MVGRLAHGELRRSQGLHLWPSDPYDHEGWNLPHPHNNAPRSRDLYLRDPYGRNPLSMSRLNMSLSNLYFVSFSFSFLYFSFQFLKEFQTG